MCACACILVRPCMCVRVYGILQYAILLIYIIKLI